MDPLHAPSAALLRSCWDAHTRQLCAQDISAVEPDHAGRRQRNRQTQQADEHPDQQAQSCADQIVRARLGVASQSRGAQQFSAPCFLIGAAIAGGQEDHGEGQCHSQRHQELDDQDASQLSRT